MSVYGVCVCMCVCGRDREREKTRVCVCVSRMGALGRVWEKTQRGRDVHDGELFGTAALRKSALTKRR